MNFFCPLQKSFAHFSTILPSLGPFCPDCSSFCPLLSSGQEWGVLGSLVELRCFVYVHIPERPLAGGLCRLSKEQGLGVVFWAK